MNLGKDLDKSILFIPVPLSFCLLLTALATGLYEAVIGFAKPKGLLLRYAVLMSAGLLTVIVILHILRPLVRDLMKLPLQIEQFSADSASCFCCSMLHVDPETGENLPCDRQLVLSVLGEWFEPPEDAADTEVEANYLDNFNALVRHNFGLKVLQQVRGARVGYWHALTFSSASFFFACDKLVICQQLSAGAALRYILHQCWIVFGVHPSIIRLAFFLTEAFHSRLGSPKNLAASFLTTLLLSLLTILAIFVLFLPPALGVAMANPSLQLASTSILALVVVLLFCDRFPWTSCSGAQAEHAATKQTKVGNYT